MSIEACGELVRRGDPDRFQTVLLAPPNLRGRLMVLYAFNLELARVAWVSREPLIAQMRLQFWLDVLNEVEKGVQPRAHEVAQPLAVLITTCNLLPEPLRQMVVARRFEIERQPFRRVEELLKYGKEGAANLIWMAAKALGASENSYAVAMEFGTGVGVAGVLQANSKFVERGFNPLEGLEKSEISGLAKDALLKISASRLKRREFPTFCSAAFLAGWQADLILKKVVANPECVFDGSLQFSEFTKRSRLMLRGVFNTW